MASSITVDTNKASDYRRFLAVKSLPTYRFCGRTAYFPSDYAGMIEGATTPELIDHNYKPMPFLMDYQADIARMATRRGKFSVFADCGLGKTLIELEFARWASSVLPRHNRTLIVTPLMVVPQIIEEARKFYGNTMNIEQVRARSLPDWTRGDSMGRCIGVTNYDALTPDVEQGNLGALVLDESSMLKSHYGSWASHCLRLGEGLRYKLACTGTPAPNDRIEYANHAVFMDAFPTVNSFLAKYFVNRGQTDNRWEMKNHAVEPFYRALSAWSIFLCNPATYGWGMDTSVIPPIVVHVHDVPLTRQQSEIAYSQTGSLFADRIGGITSRSVLSQLAKGSYRGTKVESHKPVYIRDLIKSWDGESTIVWCRFNSEQSILAEAIPGCGSIDGSTSEDERLRIVSEFKSGRIKTLISKPKILGFGLNLQVATRHVFSGLDDSYEEYYQAVKRSNRIGSTKPLNVHIPVTDLEKPMLENVMRKASRVQHDTLKQEQTFKEAAGDFIAA